MKVEDNIINNRIIAQEVRFIKLGKAECRTQLCITDRPLSLDYRDIPEALAQVVE
jgi:hypothetical protein